MSGPTGMNRSRRKAREGALTALFQIEMGGSTVTEAIEHTVLETGLSHDLADYMETIVRGIFTNRRMIDPLVERFLKGYDLERLAAVDRNLLRIATYELLYLPQVPPAVTINEAVELAKRFSTAESGKFVNGVLGKLLKETPKKDWDPATAPPEFAEESTREPEPTVEEETVAADSQEAKDAKRYGWVINSD